MCRRKELNATARGVVEYGRRFRGTASSLIKKTDPPQNNKISLQFLEKGERRTEIGRPRQTTPQFAATTNIDNRHRYFRNTTLVGADWGILISIRHSPQYIRLLVADPSVCLVTRFKMAALYVSVATLLRKQQNRNYVSSYDHHLMQGIVRVVYTRRSEVAPRHLQS